MGAETQQLPFGSEFQKSLLRLLMEDVSFGNAIVPHLRPQYFENQVLQWAFGQIVEYKASYNAIPTIEVLLEVTRHLDPQNRDLYQVTLDQVRQASLRNEDWIRATILDFVKQNIFVETFNESKALFGQGEVTRAYDVMQVGMDRIRTTENKPPDRSFFFSEFSQRYRNRKIRGPLMNAVATGIKELDHILAGGLSPGELGVWMGYAKRGKSTILANHGVQAVRLENKKVLHFVFEGSRAMVENRYDTIFAQESYNLIKISEFDREIYERLQYDYQLYLDKLIVRGFTDEWNYTADSIWTEIRDLNRLYGWDPDMLIVDYGDLLRSREKGRLSETDHQIAAFKDLKTIANRGYSLWSATQARRPKDNPDFTEDLLSSENVSYAWPIIQVLDFFGTINQTREERKAKVARLYAELYRENDASRIITVRADFDKMTIGPLYGGEILPKPITTPQQVYVPAQGKAPV